MLSHNLHCVRPLSVFCPTACSECVRQCSVAIARPDQFRRRRHDAQSSSRSEAKPARRVPRVISSYHSRPGLGSETFKSLEERVETASTAGQLFTTVDNAMVFIHAFADVHHRQERGPNRGIDLGKLDILRRSLEHSDIEKEERDLYLLTRIMLSDEAQGVRSMGRELLLTLSLSGVEIATIRIMWMFLRQDKRRQGVLGDPNWAPIRERLRDIAAQGENVPAMVLCGKVLLRLRTSTTRADNESRAISLFTTAMRVIIAEERQSPEAGSGILSEQTLQKVYGFHDFARDHEALATPWQDLADLYWERQGGYQRANRLSEKLREWESLIEAVMVGCELDDPISHFQAAEYIECGQWDEENNRPHAYTSKWLYHMTKAGASGHAHAAFRMAQYYAYTGWKYIEDEPPDHIKPTPFDKWPAPAHVQGTGSWKTVRGLISWGRSMFSPPPEATTKVEPHHHLFHSAAAFPATPSDRWKMAWTWLQTSLSWHHAPSHLLAAEIFAKETLWDQQRTPKSALKLHVSRYEAGDREDFLNGNQAGSDSERSANIDRDELNVDNQTSDSPEDLTNPYYDTDKAKYHLSQIMLAVRTERLFRSVRRQTARASNSISGRRSVRLNEEKQLGEKYIEEIMHGNMLRLSDDPDINKDLVKWFRFLEVRDMWVHDIERLYESAAALCEENGWDLYSKNGALLYQCGHGIVAKVFSFGLN